MSSFEDEVIANLLLLFLKDSCHQIYIVRFILDIDKQKCMLLLQCSYNVVKMHRRVPEHASVCIINTSSMLTCCCVLCVLCRRSECSSVSWPAVLLKQALLMASLWKRSCRSRVRLHMFPPVILSDVTFFLIHKPLIAGLWCSVTLINTDISILMVSWSSKGAEVHMSQCSHLCLCYC